MHEETVGSKVVKWVLIGVSSAAAAAPFGDGNFRGAAGWLENLSGSGNR